MEDTVASGDIRAVLVEFVMADGREREEIGDLVDQSDACESEEVPSAAGSGENSAGLTELLTEALVEDGDGDLLLQQSNREDGVLQWLQALDFQVIGACRADERLKPLLKHNASSGVAEDRLLAHLSQVSVRLIEKPSVGYCGKHALLVIIRVGIFALIYLEFFYRNWLFVGFINLIFFSFTYGLPFDVAFVSLSLIITSISSLLKLACWRGAFVCRLFPFVLEGSKSREHSFAQLPLGNCFLILSIVLCVHCGTALLVCSIFLSIQPVNFHVIITLT